MTDARSDIFLWMSFAVKPGESVGTMKPRTPSSVCAQTIAMSEQLPFVIHIFVPFRIQSSPSFFADVRIEPGSLPESGSERPKHAIASPLAIFGSHSFFCSSLPNAWIACPQSELCTDTNDRRPLSPASISSSTSPYATEFSPSVHSVSSCIRKKPRSPTSFASSRAGNSPFSYQSSTSGRIRRCTHSRATLRICFSSSERRWSMSIRSVGCRSDGLTSPNVSPETGIVRNLSPLRPVNCPSGRAMGGWR